MNTLRNIDKICVLFKRVFIYLTIELIKKIVLSRFDHFIYSSINKN